MIEKIKNMLSNLEIPSIRNKVRYISAIILLTLAVLTLCTNIRVKEDRDYSDWNHVALYILKFNDLPNNYVPKYQGVAPEETDVTVYSIYDNTRIPVKLPTGFSYTEAYINAVKGDIGTERFVFSSEQLFYTDNHYESFVEINRFDVLGVHYIFTWLFWISFSGVSIMIVFSIKWQYISINIIKSDLKNDWESLKRTCKITYVKFRKKPEENYP